MLQLFGKQICHGLDFTVIASMLFTVLNLKPILQHIPTYSQQFVLEMHGVAGNDGRLRRS